MSQTPMLDEFIMAGAYVLFGCKDGDDIFAEMHFGRVSAMSGYRRSANEALMDLESILVESAISESVEKAVRLNDEIKNESE